MGDDESEPQDTQAEQQGEPPVVEPHDTDDESGWTDPGVAEHRGGNQGERR